MNNEKKTERVLEINTDTIELYKVLKLQGLASSGGEAKLVIADGQVSVNGDVETRKRKKIVAGDLIQFAGELISIHREN
jgi:ribosome-associated protein